MDVDVMRTKELKYFVEKALDDNVKDFKFTNFGFEYCAIKIQYPKAVGILSTNLIDKDNDTPVQYKYNLCALVRNGNVYFPCDYNWDTAINWIENGTDVSEMCNYADKFNKDFRDGEAFKLWYKYLPKVELGNFQVKNCRLDARKIQLGEKDNRSEFEFEGKDILNDITGYRDAVFTLNNYSDKWSKIKAYNDKVQEFLNTEELATKGEKTLFETLKNIEAVKVNVELERDSKTVDIKVDKKRLMYSCILENRYDYMTYDCTNKENKELEEILGINYRNPVTFEDISKVTYRKQVLYDKNNI